MTLMEGQDPFPSAELLREEGLAQVRLLSETGSTLRELAGLVRLRPSEKGLNLVSKLRHEAVSMGELLARNDFFRYTKDERLVSKAVDGLIHEITCNFDAASNLSDEGFLTPQIDHSFRDEFILKLLSEDDDDEPLLPDLEAIEPSSLDSDFASELHTQTLIFIMHEFHEQSVNLVYENFTGTDEIVLWQIKHDKRTTLATIAGATLLAAFTGAYLGTKAANSR